MIGQSEGGLTTNPICSPFYLEVSLAGKSEMGVSVGFLNELVESWVG